MYCLAFAGSSWSVKVVRSTPDASNRASPSVRGVPWRYTEYLTAERELYDESTDPFELTNAVIDPGNAGVVTAQATRLRELRPGWPSSPSGAFLVA